jgi:hypothetical protein
MNSTLRYLPFRSTQGGRYDLGPFVVRTQNEHASRERPAAPQQRKGVKIQEPEVVNDHASGSFRGTDVMEPIHMWQHLAPSAEKQPPSAGIMKETAGLTDGTIPPLPSTNGCMTSMSPSKAQIAQWTLGQLVSDSLNPSVTATEAEEYERYINHPLKVPLVVTSDNSLSTASSLRERGANLELLDYVNKARGFGEGGGMRDTYIAEEDLTDYVEFLSVSEEGLTVVAEDYDKKRYKRYRQWLKGKSLFKQRVDP